MTPPPTLVALAGEACAVVVAGLIAGFGPQRLLAEVEGARRLTGPRLAGAAALAGLVVFAGLAWAGRPWLGCGLGMSAACLTAMLLVDLECMIIPDLHVVMLASLSLFGPLAGDLATLALGALVGAGLLWLVREGFRRVRGIEAMGLGDVKLMAALGALAGPQQVLWIVVCGAVLGIAWIVATHRGSLAAAPAIPFGAAAALPALVLIGLERWTR